MTTVWDDIEAAGFEKADTLVACSAGECRKHLFARMTKLTEFNMCAGNAPWWIETNTAAMAFAVKLSHNADGTIGSHACILVNRLALLEDGAKLTFHIHVDPTGEPKAKYSAGLVGRVRATSEDWFARIDSSGTSEGKGRCSHPLQHAHVGTDPNARFQARVPLYPLLPWEAVDWLLATADARFEPCPHP